NHLCYNELQIGVSRSRAHNLSRAWRILSLGHIQSGASASIVGGQTVPGNYNKLVPPPPPRPKVSQTASQPSPSTRPSYVPRFGRPAILVPDDFWSNLKQFLTERPVKVRERKDAPFIRTSFGAGLFGNLAEYFRPDPLKNRPVNSRLAVSWGGSFGTFGTRVKELFWPPQQARLRRGIEPGEVTDIWTKDGNLSTSQVLEWAARAAGMQLV